MKYCVLSRIVLSKELRTKMVLDINDSMEFNTDGVNLFLRKYISDGQFCDGKEENFFKDKFVCRSCIEHVLIK